MVADRIVSFMPDWAFVILCGVVCFIIYCYLPEELKRTTRAGLARFCVFIILFLVWLYFKSKWGLVGDDPARWPADVNYATFMVGLALVLWYMVKWMFYWHRYYTDQFVS